MALPLPQGLVPTEVAFLCEMELITIVPRQKLEPFPLLSGSTPALRPPRREDVPLWLALLLKRQRRANIVPPPWLHPESLQSILNHETKADPLAFSPPPPPPTLADPSRPGRSRRPYPSDISAPFLPSSTSTAPSTYLPYHWLELAEMLLTHAAEDIVSAPEVRSLLKDIHEARAAKMRNGTAQLGEGVDGVMSLRGVGGMELAENRSFVVGVVDGVRKIGMSAEMARREEEERGGPEDEDDEEMEL